MDIGHARVVQPVCGFLCDPAGGRHGAGAIDDAVIGAVAPDDVIGGGQNFGQGLAAARLAGVGAKEIGPISA